jgi:membrane-associated phospholipid phosphatase
MSVHLINPSDNAFGTAVIAPRWLFVLAAATPRALGDPVILDETLEQLVPETIQPGGEALLDGVVVEQGMKLIFWRERPAMDHSRGLFFQGDAGLDSSFPSSHSVLAGSTAAVIAGEYPSRWSQLGIYSLATGVSVTSVLGQEHFPTDVLVGSAAGWLVGHYVYRAHHRHALEAR